MAGNVRNYFAAGHTARGFYDLFDSVLGGLERVYILLGGPGTGKSTLMEKIGEEMRARGYGIERLHSASDNGCIDGIIIRDLNVGIVDGTAPNVITPQAPGAVERYVTLESAWDTQQLNAHKGKIKHLNTQMNECYAQAYDTFAKALRIHDEELERIFVANLDVSKANELSERLIERFYSQHSRPKQPQMRHAFLGAATPEGPVDFIQNLTADVNKRYFIKGPPGSGKSHMMKKILREAERRGFDAEVYHCGFDPHSIDMVLLPELGIAIFDSTDPHEHFPERDGDDIIDMSKEAIAPHTSEKYAAAINESHGRYKSTMKAATSRLAQAKTLRDALKAIYAEATDFTKLDTIRQNIQAEIDAMPSLNRA